MRQMVMHNIISIYFDDVKHPTMHQDLTYRIQESISDSKKLCWWSYDYSSKEKYLR